MSWCECPLGSKRGHQMELERPLPVTKPDVLCCWNCGVTASLCWVMKGCVVVNRTWNNNDEVGESWVNKSLWIARLRWYSLHYRCVAVRSSSARTRATWEFAGAYCESPRWTCSKCKTSTSNSKVRGCSRALETPRIEHYHKFISVLCKFYSLLSLRLSVFAPFYSTLKLVFPFRARFFSSLSCRWMWVACSKM